MGSIAALRRDIWSQEGMLGSFVPQEPLPRRAQARAVFTGSGDSLAAAMLAEALSGGLARAADPHDLYRDPQPSRTAYVVSVSGRTSAGLRAARRAGRYVAVTADPSGRLARGASRVVRVGPGGGTLTAGSVTFLESALACASLVAPVRAPRWGPLLGAASRAARAARPSGGLFVLGSRLTYPLAMYCAAKLYEVLGLGARYCRTEQFFHMELFCARPGDAAVLLEEASPRTDRLLRALRGAGIRAVRPPLPRAPVRQIAFCALYSQLLALLEAERRGMEECHFVTAGAARGASDSVIY